MKSTREKNKETLIILGAGVMQGPVIKIAKELGFYAIALDGSKDAPCVSMADQFEWIDLKEKEEIESFARRQMSKGGRLGIMTAGTDFSASVAWVAERLGLPGIPYKTALKASDKSLMRECFKKASLPSPDFITINADDDLEKIKLPFPLVVKPVDNMGSRGCRRVDAGWELRAAAKTAIGFSKSGRAILESFMEGPEYSVDAIIYKGEITICGLADRHISFPPYFIEMGHTMPSVIGKEKRDQILDTFRAGIRALGLSDGENIGAAKGDMKLTSKGEGTPCVPMIGEIAARLSGGYMSGWTYPYSSGARPIEGAILAAMGKKPSGLVPEKNWVCAERAFISIPGTVKKIIGIGDRAPEDHVNDVFSRIKEGDKVSFPENNVTKCGNVIASAQDRRTAIDAAMTAARSILIKLDPNDQETMEFLARREKDKRVFPPDAFALSEELEAALNQLPDPPVQRSQDYSSEPSLLQNGSALVITPFQAFMSCGRADYMGRTVAESLDAVRELTGFSLPLSEKNAENLVTLGRSFWTAFIRGGYQGAVYYIEKRLTRPRSEV